MVIGHLTTELIQFKINGVLNVKECCNVIWCMLDIRSIFTKAYRNIYSRLGNMFVEPQKACMNFASQLGCYCTWSNILSHFYKLAQIKLALNVDTKKFNK